MKGVGKVKENQYEMEKHTRASNRRKPLPPLDLKVKERECYQNPGRAIGVMGVAVAVRGGFLTEAMILKRVLGNDYSTLLSSCPAPSHQSPYSWKLVDGAEGVDVFSRFNLPKHRAEWKRSFSLNVFHFLLQMR